MQWAATPGAASYDVQVATVPDFSTTVNDTTTQNTSHTATGLGLGTYLARARAKPNR